MSFLETNLLHQLARHIKRVMPIPDNTISYAAAIALLSGIAGRRYNTPTRTGLNQYVVILGRTGIGKEGAMTGIGSIFKSLEDPDAAMDRFLGPGYIASGQALLGELVENKSIVSSIGEIGHLFRQLSTPNTSPADTFLLRMLLTLHNKSGVNDVLTTSVWADKNKNLPNIIAPSFSILGDSTPRYFYKGMNPEMIQQGLYPRLMVFEVDKELPAKPPTSYSSSVKLTDKVKNQFAWLIGKCSEDDITICHWEKDAQEILDAYFYECNKQRQRLSHTPAEDILTRSHIKALRLATLFAVCQERDTTKTGAPIITASQALHAIKIEKFATSSVLDRIAGGNIGTETTERQKLNTLLGWLSSYLDVKNNPSAYETDWAKHDLKDIQLVRRRGVVPVALIYPALSDHVIFEGVTARRKELSSLLCELVHHERLQLLDRHSDMLLRADGKEITAGECYQIVDLSPIGTTHVDWELD